MWDNKTRSRQRLIEQHEAYVIHLYITVQLCLINALNHTSNACLYMNLSKKSIKKEMD